MDSHVFTRVKDKEESIYVRQTSQKISIKNITNDKVVKEKTTTVKVEEVLKEKEFISCESLLTQLAGYSHLQAYKNILTSFGIFYCLQTISNDFRIYKK